MRRIARKEALLELAVVLLQQQLPVLQRDDFVVFTVNN